MRHPNHSKERVNVLKRLLAIVLSVTLVLTGVVFFAAFSYEGAAEKVAVSDFYFHNGSGDAVTELENNMTLKAGCHMKGTGAEDQPYVFMTVVYDGGKMISATPSEGTIAPGEEKDVSVEVTLGEDVSAYRVMSYLWSDLQSMELLTSPATFGGSEAELAFIEIDGISVPGIKKGLYDYTLEVPLKNAKVPTDISVTGKDLTVQTTVTNMTTFPGSVQIATKSHDGKTTANYQVNLQLAAPKTMKITSDRGAAKIYYAEEVKGHNLPHTGNATLQTRNADFSGSTQVEYLNFDLSDLPEGAVLQGATLKLNAYAPTSTGNTLEAFDCTGAEWETYAKKGFVTYDSKNPLSKEPLSIDGTSFQAKEMKLDASRITGDTLTVMLRKNFLAAAPTGFAYVDLKTNLPVLELSYYAD